MQIETPRLRLRPFTPGDLDELCRLAADPEVMRFIGNGSPKTREETAERLTQLVGHWPALGYGMWAVHEKQTGRFVGRCGLQPLADTGEVEVGYMLHREFWGRGLATEGAAAAVRFGFEAAGLPRIVAIVLPENTASRRVIEKTGLLFERVGPNPYGPRDVVWYGLSRAGYEASRRHGLEPQRSPGI